jgi:hypothetical protein
MLKSFTVVFIPNCYRNEDDPSDYKQWKDVEAKDSEEACYLIGLHATIVRCTEN